MQNTTTFKEIPDKLIENFFITGLSQQSLMQKFKSSEGNMPQVLFSMYTDADKCKKFNQYVFPNKIHIQYKYIAPCFQTFMTKEQEGNQSFFHCFTFHEKLNEYQITGDFDYEGIAALKRRKKKKKDESDTTTVYDMATMHRNKVKEDKWMRATTKKQIKAQKIFAMHQNDTQYSDEETEITQIKQLVPNKALQINYSGSSGLKVHGRSPSRASQFMYIPGSASKSSIELDKRMISSHSQIGNFNIDEKQNLRLVQQSSPQFDFAQLRPDDTSMSNLMDRRSDYTTVTIDQNTKDQLNQYVYVPVAFVIQTKVEFHDAFKMILKSLYESISKPKEYPQELQFKSKEKCVPDLNQMMAFTEMLQHVAMLRTIPAPVFNSEINLHFNDLLINLKEKSFNELPHKNQNAIQILMEVLDFKTILTCIKAVLFEKTLIVLSSEVSLLFQVVEGIKQLIFPFTFDNQQFLYANTAYVDQKGNTLVTMLEQLNGMQAVVFAIQTPYDPEQYKQLFQYPNAVVLDADFSHCEVTPASFDDDEFLDEPVQKRRSKEVDAPMPQFPNEFELLKTLHIIKNRKKNHYDKVYYEENQPEEYEEEHFIVDQVRVAIFRSLKPFLVAAYMTIKPKKQTPKFLSEFWNEKSYFEYIDERFEPSHEYIKFAESLIKGTSFSRFMDGYIDDVLSNYDVCNSILCCDGDLKRRYKDSCSTIQMFSSHICTKLKDNQQLVRNFSSQIDDHLKDPRLVFNDEVVRFNFKLPSYIQRQMLLEKIFFMLEKHKAKKGNVFVSSVPSVQDNKNNEEYLKTIENKNVKYKHEFIIQNAKAVYNYLEIKSKKVVEVQQIVQPRKDLPDIAPTPRFQSSLEGGMLKVLARNKRTSTLKDIMAKQQSSELDLVPFAQATFGNLGPSEHKTADFNQSGVNGVDASELNQMLSISIQQKREATMGNIQPISVDNNTFQGELKLKNSALLVKASPYRENEEQDHEKLELGESYLVESAQFNGIDERDKADTILKRITHDKMPDALTIKMQKSNTIDESNPNNHLNGRNLKKQITAQFQVQDTIFPKRITSNIQMDQMFEPKQDSRGDNQSQFFMSEVKSSFVPQERSQSLMYGKKGLLNFLQNLFVDLNEKDKQKINFYFTIRNNILEFVDLKHQFNKKLMSKNIQQFSNEMLKSGAQNYNNVDYNGHLCQPNRMMTIIRNDLQITNQTDNVKKLNVYSNCMLFKSQMSQNIQKSCRKISMGMNSQTGFIDAIDIQSQSLIDDSEYSRNYDENDWFWIESDSLVANSNSSQRELSAEINTPKSVFQTLSYQEVLFFIKFVTTFEDKKHHIHMILQLISNFPLVWKPLPKEIIEHKGLSNSLGFNQQDAPYQQSKFEILEYLFPLSKLLVTLDNLSRQEIIQLDQLISDPEYLLLRRERKVWSHLTIDYTSNELSSGRIKEIPTYKDLIKFLIQNKSDQAQSIIQKDSKFEFDLNKRNKNFVEVIDESYFKQYSIQKYNYDKEKLKQQSLRMRSSSHEMLQPISKNQSCDPQTTKNSHTKGFNFKQIFKIDYKKKSDKKCKKEKTSAQRSSEEFSIDHVNLDKEQFDNLLVARDRQTLAKIHSKGFQEVQQVTNPVQLSMKLLKQIVKFWIRENEPLLTKYSKSEKNAREQRIKALSRIQRDHVDQLRTIVPDFTFKEDNMYSDSKFASLSKQCFYVNIYNFLILFKMAELATLKPLSVFDLKNESSWLALEQNVSIWINNQEHTAFNIKNDIVKKMKDDHLHPLIDFAFFMPKGGNLKLEDVCFDSIWKLDHSFRSLVNAFVSSKMHINSKFSLIMLPECLKPCLPVFIPQHKSSKEQKWRMRLDYVHQTLCTISQSLDPKGGKQEEIQKIIDLIREQLDEREQPKEKREWIIEFIPHDQRIKKQKITKGLEQYYREFLRDI